MSNDNGGATIDSLTTFKYKKKFTFTKNKSLLSTDDNASDNGSNASNNDSTDEDDNSDLEELRNKNLNWKGSAKLKDPNNAENDDANKQSSEEEEKDKAHKKHKKKSKKSRKDTNNEEKLEKLYRMFPHYNVGNIQKVFAEHEFNAKKCAVFLLKEKENAVLSVVEKDADKKKSVVDVVEIEGESEDEIGNKKRKECDEPLDEPLKKRAKKLIVSSDDEEDEIISSRPPKNQIADSSDEPQSEDESNPAKKSKSVTNKSDSNDSESDSAKSAASSQNKPTKKKLRILNSSEDDEVIIEKEDTKKKSSSKKSKKDKKEKKKSVKIDDEEFEEDDDNYEKGGGGGGCSDDSDFEGDNYSDYEKGAILKMFNEASIEDIQSMININKPRVKSLIALRPYVDFIDLRTRLSQRSLINTIDSVKDIIVARNIVGSLLEKCLKISQKLENQVKALIESTTDSDSELKTNNVLELKVQPACLNKNLQLKPYQLIGLNWLCLMHKENINGILADEMGLGKTCQTIAFLAHLFEQNKKLMHLIIVPPSTLDNWVREISTWCPDFNFTVYQGSLEERRQLRMDVFNNRFEKPLNAILTTYGLISSTNEDKNFFRKIKINYCVFDEAHMLKNMNSQRYQALIKVPSKHKLLLTGTPLQNNLVELMSLLYFVMPDIFHHKTEYLNKIFAQKPTNTDTDTFYQDKITQAKGIMNPFILRRLKTEVLKQLPKKVIEVITCDMTLRQGKEYKKLIEHFKAKKELILKEAEEAADAKKKSKGVKKGAQVESKYEEMMQIMDSNKKKGGAGGAAVKDHSPSNIIMELRKAANHPLLRRCIYTDAKILEMAKLVFKESPPDTNLEYVREDMSVMSDFQLHKLCPLYRGLKGYELTNADILDSAKFTILDSLLAEKKESGDRCLIFSQFVIMLDIVEDFLKIKKYKYFRLDGSTAVSERQDMIDAYNHDKEIFIFLLSTKAGGVGINLTAANVVIMHDIDWNPFNDKQAEDRCHRVGQTKEVCVYKLVAKNTIDCTMLKIQEKKMLLDEDLIGQNEENQKVDMMTMLSDALKC